MAKLKKFAGLILGFFSDIEIQKQLRGKHGIESNNVHYVNWDYFNYFNNIFSLQMSYSTQYDILKCEVFPVDQTALVIRNESIDYYGS